MGKHADIINDLVAVLEAYEGGDCLLSNQGQALDGYAALANFVEIARRARDYTQSKRKRKPNPMFDEVARVWNLHPQVHGSRIAKIARDLTALGATVTDIGPAHQRAVAAWGDKGQTPECLVKHWAKFGTAPKSPSSPAEKWVSGA